MTLPFPASSEKGPGFPLASQEEVLSYRKDERNSMGHANIPKVPQMSQCTPEEVDFPALPQFSRRVSTHTMVARVTDLWESLVGKPREKATDSCINASGSLICCYSSGEMRTCMSPLETRTDSPVGTPEVAKDPRKHWRENLRFQPLLHTRS